MKQDHVIELGKISLDCLIIGELDLGRVCHCLGKHHMAATHMTVCHLCLGVLARLLLQHSPSPAITSVVCMLQLQPLRAWLVIKLLPASS